MVKVKIDSTSSKYRDEGIKEFKDLQHAIWYCWKIADDRSVIVEKPFDWDPKLKMDVTPDYDFDLEIYDDYRE